MLRVLKLVLIALFGLAALPMQGLASGQQFDFQHVRAALEYFEDPSPAGIAGVAFTDAADHLARHAAKTNYYPRGTSRFAISQDLLANPPDEQMLSTVKAMMTKYTSDLPRQARCFSEARAMLPESLNALDTSLYVTWGYDIGVAIDGTASLNMTHPKFVQDPNEFWYYCVHELHHAGVMTLHPFPFNIDEISNTAELTALVDYSTFLEGTAVWAAYEARRIDGALDNDSDYVVLDSPILMSGIIDEYNTLRQKLAGPARPLTNEDWAVIDGMSSGDRLWYRVGAHMAREIEQASGRDALLRAIAGGSGAFFAAYDSIQ